MGCWSPGVWPTEGSLTFVLIGGISGSRGRLLIKWSAGYLSIQMNRSAATIFCTVTIFCVVTVFEISSLWLPLQCSTMGQQKTLQKQQEEHLKNALLYNFISFNWTVSALNPPRLLFLLDPQPHTYNGSRVLVKLRIVSFLWIAYITKSFLSFYYLSVWAPHVWRVFFGRKFGLFFYLAGGHLRSPLKASITTFWCGKYKFCLVHKHNIHLPNVPHLPILTKVVTCRRGHSP